MADNNVKVLRGVSRKMALEIGAVNLREMFAKHNLDVGATRSPDSLNRAA